MPLVNGKIFSILVCLKCINYEYFEYIKVSYGLSSVPANPTCTQITPQAPTVSIPIESLGFTNGHVSKSHHLLLRIMNITSNSDSENTGKLRILHEYYLFNGGTYYLEMFIYF